MIGKLLLALWILGWIGRDGGGVLWIGGVAASDWPTVLDESLDEKNDAMIFRSVVESMREWEFRKRYPRRAKREASRVCYEEVGCFEDTGPFSYLEMLPSPPKDVGTRFLVYGSRKARSIPTEVPAENINDNAHRVIDPELPTKVIVHGFGSSCDHIWVYEMRSALMSVHECNIVCVDWGPGSAVPNYVRAAANTRLVGRQLAKLVRSLNVPLEKVHLIGFSLGAHVAGFAGAELGNVSRITGLDPAGPLFESQDPRARLDATDANFVDVIHSNGEQLILGGLGSWQPMGDVDFYPNGGRMQTGCSNLFLGAVSDIIWSSAVEGRSLCNHRRAYKLFTDSVSPKCRFPAFPCEHGYDGLLRGDCFPCGVSGTGRPCGDMGYYSDQSSARGQLYLLTRDEEPFCAHQYQIKVYNSRSERPARSYGKLQITLVGEVSFNETFTMTKKDDEELLVGAILQKIVVPHPAVTNLHAIEIKYTAYSGWISSGLVSWSIDKVVILDSFGKGLSICKKGLILESGQPIYLPLYPGECNIPVESSDSTTASTIFEATAGTTTANNSIGTTTFDSNMDSTAIIGFTTTELPDTSFKEKLDVGIGPFTKEQNYDRDFSVEVLPKETSGGGQGLGPFTRDQNIRVFYEGGRPSKEESSREESKVKKKNNREELRDKKPRIPLNPWSVLDLEDSQTNSLENTEAESGRGFSGTNVTPRGFSYGENSEGSENSRRFDWSTDFPREIEEPVLKLPKKESGRSLRLPEITEPILHPRSARQNTGFGGVGFRSSSEKSFDPAETSSTRGFTVQFLPERLAGILAQAERYARQTLLPLISQYTPSFIGGQRSNYGPTYFPPLGDIADETLDESSSVSKVSSENQWITTTTSTTTPSSVTHQERSSRPLENASRESSEVKNRQETEWLPVQSTETKSNLASSTENSEEVKINNRNATSHYTETENGRNKLQSKDEDIRSTDGTSDEWSASPRTESRQDPASETKLNDWLPIINGQKFLTKDAQPIPNTTEPEFSLSSNTTSNLTSNIVQEDETIKETQKIQTTPTTKMPLINIDRYNKKENNSLPQRQERQFIPLIDFAQPDNFFSPSWPNKSQSPTSSTAQTSTESEIISHIQRIPRINNTRTRAMIFPYAYERQKDPRTRYIPLIPQEDMGKTKLSLAERES
ncbi:uncharacterized protein LOC107273844 isoform X2 [Cephus cinctus]|uniref:phospholipase A1 n=1 Tax=Cephus cinctus TaxID=211228 RepID=A0AAJ7CDG8_CEPCN|nr:uncharacterized protein LOC107273844 isoform X2 [Cephus cinctus]XP_015607900.1 uncharacterized protein LOC107273844 isoform X2 [Cephus cinctus]